MNMSANANATKVKGRPLGGIEFQNVDDAEIIGNAQALIDLTREQQKMARVITPNGRRKLEFLYSLENAVNEFQPGDKVMVYHHRSDVPNRTLGDCLRSEGTFIGFKKIEKYWGIVLQTSEGLRAFYCDVSKFSDETRAYYSASEKMFKIQPRGFGTGFAGSKFAIQKIEGDVG